MKLSIAIVGLPNVGKSTLFKAITKNEVNIANYPFCTIDPNIGVVAVPDERLDKLAEMSRSKKKVPAIVEFYDVAGLVKGANKGEGLGNQFLSHIRVTQAIVQVLRCFPAGEIIHVENSVDPIRDLEIINTELALKDLETIDKSSRRIEGEAKSGKKEAIKELEILQQAKDKLSRNQLITDLKDEPIIKNLQLLCAKTQMYLLNGKLEDVNENIKKRIQELGAQYVIADLSNPGEAIHEVIRKAYAVFNLISFFTTGEDESGAWTIENGWKAPQAAGTIHGDFEKKFIRAETINWQKLLDVKSWTTAKQKGMLRSEGKEYFVQDGDVLEIKHS